MQYLVPVQGICSVLDKISNDFKKRLRGYLTKCQNKFNLSIEKRDFH